MKKHLSFLTALLLLLSLTACGTASAKDEPNQDSSTAQTDTPPEPSGTFTPVTTEEEVRALYANVEDAEIISVEEYQGSFLVTLGEGSTPAAPIWTGSTVRAASAAGCCGWTSLSSAARFWNLLPSVWSAEAPMPSTVY